jgi:GrpB-like predicted nucleotidyltransferase (UPF0157 family)
MTRIAVLDWDPGWPGIAVAVQAELRSTLPAGSWQHLEHIGSTSVPGLAAKPVIDLMGSVIDLDRFGALAGKHLDPLGYLLTDTGMTGRLFYRRASGRTLMVHLHIVPAQAWPTQNERILRDFLTCHPDAVRRYGDLKRGLAATIDDPLEYTRAKTALVQELVDLARAERGLPVVNVWPD